mmetsp:Transcript_78151/g.156413  ORF Transcript_78151/g.156413 Transcript_78151/m.156413 type:complete len:301 (-) Transcript_78151:515-1417(-)
MPKAYTLRLVSDTFNERVLFSYFDSEYHTPVQRVDLRESNANDTHVELIVKHWGSDLVFINLSRTSVTDESLRLLRACPRLKIVIANGTSVTDEGVEALSQQLGPQLKRVDLRACHGVSDESLRSLANHCGRSLKQVGVDFTRCSAAGAEVLESRCAGLRLLTCSHSQLSNHPEVGAHPLCAFEPKWGTLSEQRRRRPAHTANDPFSAAGSHADKPPPPSASPPDCSPKFSPAPLCREAGAHVSDNKATTKKKGDTFRVDANHSVGFACYFIGVFRVPAHPAILVGRQWPHPPPAPPTGL